MLETRYYGEYGGAYLPEILVSTFEELAAAFQEVKNDPGFWQEYKDLMSTYSCRPTPLTTRPLTTCSATRPSAWTGRKSPTCLFLPADAPDIR